jgi:hypothetical protein
MGVYGYFGGWVDAVTLRINDAFHSIPLNLFARSYDGDACRCADACDCHRFTSGRFMPNVRERNWD